jgi:NitT/TauT family transport system substrate-binding protein
VIVNKVWRNSDPGPKHLPHGAVAAYLFAILLAASSSAGAQGALKSASLMPLWSPQAQFAGYYVALEKGIYRRHGIDLTLLTAGPGQSPAEALRNGTADFAILWLSTALQHRSEGVPLINLGQVVQRSSLLLVARKASGIASISNMEGKKVGLWEGDLSIPARALFGRNQVRVREVRQSWTVNLFLRGGIDVASAMWYNEYHTILHSGIDAEELNVFSVGEEGFDFPEDGMYALDALVRRDPELAEAFVAASLEGWRYAFEHPEEALDIVIRRMREARLPANRVHQRWMLDRMRDLVWPEQDTSNMGQLDPGVYEFVGRTLQQVGLIGAYPDHSAFSWSHDADER